MPSEIHDELLLIQRRMRFLRLKTSSSIDPQAQLVLPVIEASGKSTLQNMAGRLAMDPSNFSKLIKHLQQKKVIRLSKFIEDNRIKHLSLTEEGERVLDSIKSQDRYYAEVGMRPLIFEERQFIGKCFEAISNGLQIDRDQTLSGEELFLVEQKRLARGTGMLGSNYMESGYDIGIYQLLYSLLWGGELRFTDFLDKVPLERSVVSRQISRLTQKGILLKRKHSTDSRSIAVSFSKKAEKEFTRVHKSISRSFGSAFEQLSIKDQKQFFSLVRKAADFQNEISTVLECKTESDFKIARAFYVEQLVQNKEHTSLSASLLPNSLKVFLYKEHSDVLGLLALQGNQIVAFETLSDKAKKSLTDIAAVKKIS